MANFEIFIPASDPEGFNVTARVEADSWMHALRNGLQKLGDGIDVRNVLCDIHQDYIDVTDPVGGRVFRIKEIAVLPEAKPAPVPSVPAPAPASAAAPAPAPAPAPAVSAAPPAAPARPPSAAPPPPIAAAPAPAASAGGAGAGAPFVEGITRQRASEGPQFSVGRAKAGPNERRIEDVLAELFEQTAELHSQPDLKSAARLILNLAVKTIPSDAGSVYVADINSSDLYFGAAIGPKADEVMKFRVAVGQGIVGFSTQEGVAVAISDAQRDPRFFSAISDKLGYDTHSILCSPAQRNGRLYGAIQLINKKGNSTFTGHEVDILNYLSHQFAEYLEATGQAGL